MIALLQRLRRHWRQGTLIDAVQVRLGITPAAVRVKWHGARNEREAARGLARYARFVAAQGSERWVLSVGDGNPFHMRLNQRLSALGVPHRSHRLEELAALSGPALAGVALILAGYPDARRTLRLATVAAAHPALGAVPLEYAAGLGPEAAAFRRLDEYRDTFFQSPVLLDDPSPYALYEESLQLFEQKCGLRDYLDLYQLLRQVVRDGVPGDVAEFGSYKGHSGWLIARTLQALGSDKRLYMFDAFEQFPQEAMGVDQFWSSSHHVDFAEVQRKLAGFANVRLVKGDFTRTLATSDLGAVALAFVDCDSYRATRYLIDALLPGSLSPRGALVCEDYGHPALLGNRAAVHESLAQQPDVFQFFSQFSGLYVVIKLPVRGNA